eukprot:CAMPEP_0183467774 /NCGR_PEP_ID=MMETSP0370-20130417/151545_1 /TAXON_ID=268820 /ORGANISM="Peridinium aciculiferum, Strain PAER-2" /LENGTH=57 /DNA_ID=CAMNT_0025660129 /DNA_START=179 /DNA_END=349 /DNA_ORIENTATION=-
MKPAPFHVLAGRLVQLVVDFRDDLGDHWVATVVDGGFRGGWCRTISRALALCLCIPS